MIYCQCGFDRVQWISEIAMIKWNVRLQGQLWENGIFSKLHKLLLVVCRSFGSPHPFKNLGPNTYNVLRSLVTASIYVL